MLDTRRTRLFTLGDAYLKTGWPLGHGYDLRPKGSVIQSVLIHATHGHTGSDLVNEANFLQDSTAVGCHYLIGRGDSARSPKVIYLILPDYLMAWHSGDCDPDVFENPTSIGIELHASSGEQITDWQKSAARWLVSGLMFRYRIAINRIETHSQVARPGPDIRKKDPSTWKGKDFYDWRSSLVPQPLEDPFSYDLWSKMGIELDPVKQGWGTVMLWRQSHKQLGAATTDFLYDRLGRECVMFQGGAIFFPKGGPGKVVLW